jgi:hypothetical protein
MAEMARGAGIDEVRAAPRWWRRWPEWVGYAAAAWSLTCGALGLWWALGGAGFPFGRNDPRADEVGSLFGAAEPGGRPTRLRVRPDATGGERGDGAGGPGARPRAGEDRTLRADGRLTMDEPRLDGNADAGALGEVFAFEATNAEYACGACGRTGRLGAAVAHEVRGSGVVIRCPGCDNPSSGSPGARAPAGRPSGRALPRERESSRKVARWSRPLGSVRHRRMSIPTAPTGPRPARSPP